MDKAELYAILKEYLHFIGGSVLAITILGNLTTWFIQHRFNREIERYKQELQEQLEEHKKSIQKELAHFNAILPDKVASLRSVLDDCIIIDESVKEFFEYWSFDKGKQPPALGREMSDCYHHVLFAKLRLEERLSKERLHLAPVRDAVNTYLRIAYGVFAYDNSPNKTAEAYEAAIMQIKDLEAVIKTQLEA